MVSPSTVTGVPTIKGKAEAKPKSDLVYGMMRAVIDPNGPRSGLEVKTASAVAGVRGTDLCIGFNPGERTTEVTVLRGKVNLKSGPSEHATTAKSVEVASGEKAAVIVDTKVVQGKPHEEYVSQVDFSTREELLNIQNETTVVAQGDVPKEQVAVVAALETKAAESAIVDIQKYHPEIAKDLIAKGATTTDQVNSRVLLDLYKAAPGEKYSSGSSAGMQAKARAKPRAQDLEKIDDDVYKKYFEKFTK